MADRFAVRMPGGVYLSMETTFHLVCALIFGPVMAAWVAGVSALVSELVIFRRAPDFIARTIGMYIAMWLAGGAVYQALGGAVPLTRLEGPELGYALVLFLVVTAVNIGVMALDSLLRGTPSPPTSSRLLHASRGSRRPSHPSELPEPLPIPLSAPSAASLSPWVS